MVFLDWLGWIGHAKIGTSMPILSKLKPQPQCLMKPQGKGGPKFPPEAPTLRPSSLLLAFYLQTLQEAQTLFFLCKTIYSICISKYLDKLDVAFF
ncbi:hypothetical protein SLE2022_136120 [Rubroshorea leprosula]